MQFFVRLLICHLVLFAVIVVTWAIGFVVTIPVVSLLENRAALKIVGPGLVILFVAVGLSVYLYTLNKIYHFELLPFIIYATIPVVTYLIIAYKILKSIRFGW